jgi:hypothetical protein
MVRWNSPIIMLLCVEVFDMARFITIQFEGITTWVNQIMTSIYLTYFAL